MKMFRKTFAVLLVLALALCLAPAVFAAEDGTSPETAYEWTFDSWWGLEAYNCSVTTNAGAPTYVKFSNMAEDGEGYLYITPAYAEPTGAAVPATLKVKYTAAGGDTGEKTFDLTMSDGWNFDTAVTLVGSKMIAAEEVVTLEISVYDAEGNIIEAYLEMQGGIGSSTTTPVSLYDTEALVHTLTVDAGDTVHYQYNGWDWQSCGGVLLTSEGGIDQDSALVINGESFTDENGNGTIQAIMAMNEDTYGYAVGITNGGSAPRIYTLTMTAEAQSECSHEKDQLTTIEAQEHGCHTPEIVKHQQCECGLLFDMEGNPVSEAEVYVFDECDNQWGLNEMPGTEPTCTEPGLITYYHCYSCGGNYIDEDGYEKVTNYNVPAINHANAQHYEEMAATCGQPGSTGYYRCPDCGLYFRDEACTEEITEEEAILPLDPDNHEWIEEEVIQEHSCEQDGIIQYKCEYCWDEENDKPITKTETTPAGHTLVHHEATDESIEYWSCEDCGKLYADAEAKTEITDEADLIPPTGDMNVFVPLAVALVSMGGILVLAKKKED